MMLALQPFLERWTQLGIVFHHQDTHPSQLPSGTQLTSSRVYSSTRDKQRGKAWQGALDSRKRELAAPTASPPFP